MTGWVVVTTVEDLTPGSYRQVELDNNITLAVFNVGGDFFAIEDRCSHDHTQLTGGRMCANIIFCPRHNAQFDVRNGQALTPPAYEPVATYATRVRNGRIEVACSPAKTR